MRYILVVVVADQAQGPVALLFDRKFRAYTMQGMEGLGAALGEGTCLDGEVVRNRSWGRDIFMVFDCLSVGKVTCAGEKLSKRLWRLQNEVLAQRYLKFLAEHGMQVTAQMTLLPLVMKHFQATNKIREITRHIAFEGADRVYLERDAQGAALPARKRHHKSDGLIFVPDKPYHRGTDTESMKWKWHDTITLDFECRRSRNERHEYGVSLSFPAEGSDRVDFTEHITMVEQVSRTLNSLTLSLSHTHTVEMYVD